MAYLIDGEEVEVIERVASGVIVRRAYTSYSNDEDDGDGESAFGQPELVPAVYDRPPVLRMAPEIPELEAREKQLRIRIAGLEAKARELAAAESRVDKLLNFAPAMARLEDVLSGRVTHYLENHEYGSLRVIEADRGAVRDTDDRGRWTGDTRLLCLFGKSSGDLQWRINRYCDDSGGWTDVEPFTSRDAAIARLQSLVDAFAGEKPYRQGALHKAAKEYGLQIPKALEEAVTKARREGLKKKVSEAQAELDKALAAAKECDA